jgi:hypothetical protein
MKNYPSPHPYLSSSWAGIILTPSFLLFFFFLFMLVISIIQNGGNSYLAVPVPYKQSDIPSWKMEQNQQSLLES